MHICQSLDNTITNAKCISPSDICIKTAYMSNAYIQNCIWLIARSQLQSMYCGMWWWLYIPSWGYHAILLQSSIYFCNKIYAISGYDWFGMTSSYSNDIPLDSWPIFGAINDAIISHCDNCCVYHTSISIISAVPNTMRSNLIHGSRLSSNNTKVDCCISSCLFLEYSCARCCYCIAIFLLVWWQWSRCRLQPRFV